MITEKSKEHALKTGKDCIEKMEKELKELRRQQKELAKEVVFEETLQGQIVTERQILMADIHARLDRFTEVTGIEMTIGVGEVRQVNNTKEPVAMEELQNCLQREALQTAFDYCINNGSWKQKKDAYNWIHAKLDDWFRSGSCM